MMPHPRSNSYAVRPFKPKPFRAAKQVKAMAREAIGSPPPERVEPDTKKKAARRKQKHKATFGQLLSEE